MKKAFLFFALLAAAMILVIGREFRVPVLVNGQPAILKITVWAKLPQSN